MQAYSLPERKGTGFPPGLIRVMRERERGQGPLTDAFNQGFDAGFNQQWPQGNPFPWGDPRLEAFWQGFDAGFRAQQPLFSW